MTDDILATARKNFQLATDADQENIDAGMQDLSFAAGEQWEAQALWERTARGAPCPTINRIPQFVNKITGDMRKNRPRIKVNSVDGGEKGKAISDIYEGLIRTIERNSDADTAYIKAGENAVKCGIGHFRISDDWEANDSYYKELRVKEINNPFAVIWDFNAKDLTRKDAMYCFVLDRMGYDAFKEQYPDAAISSWEDVNRASALSGFNLNAWASVETIQVAEYWYKKPYKRIIMRFENGVIHDFTEKEFAENKPYIDEATLKSKIIRDDYKICRVLMTAAEILEETEWAGKYFPIIPVVGHEDFVGDRVKRRGIVRNLKDPQRMYNYMRGVQMQIMQQQLTAPFIGTAKQIEGNEQAWARANHLDMGYLTYTPDPMASSPPQRQNPPVASSALTEQVAIASEEMKSTTGIYDASLGNRSNETSGKAILARQAEGDVVTILYMDNLAMAIKHAGRILVDLIPHYYNEERVIRILKEDGTEDVQVINKAVGVAQNGLEMVYNDVSVGRYDVDIDSGANYNTKRQQAADSLLELMRTNPALAGTFADLFVKNLDIPLGDQIAKRIQKTLPPNMLEGENPNEPMQPPPPPNPKDVAQAEKMQAETDGIKLDNVQKQLQLQADNGQFNQLIQQIVQQELQNILGGIQQQQQPMQEMQGMPQEIPQEPIQQPQGLDSLPLGLNTAG